MSTRPPLSDDPEVLHQIRRAFPRLLKDRAFTLHGADVDDSTCLGFLRLGKRLVILQGHQPTLDGGHADHHPYFTAEEGRGLTNYQLVQANHPNPQPVLGVTLTGPDEGVVGGVAPVVPIVLQRAGTAQLWWGGGIGEIWDATLDQHDLQADPKPLQAFWYALETSLRQRGCYRVFTLARDTRYPDGTYRHFLRDRGYEAIDEHEGPLAWVKKL